MNNLTVIELAAWLNDEARPQPLLLDVRESWEYRSVLIPMNSIPDQLAELKREQPVVCICHHGMRSMQVAHFLDQNGFSNVSNLSGGVDAWARQVGSEMPTY